LVLRKTELVNETLIRKRLIDGIQIFPLEIFHEGELEHLLFGASRHITHDNGHFKQPCALRRAPSPLASNDSVCTPGSTHQNRLNDAVRADRSRQLFELAIVDEDPRLVIVRDQQIDVNLDGAGARHLRRVRDERTQTFT
jgi:hypothetical protein